jgi:hypothetical protein
MFSVYRDMREKLMARGVPAEEIAFAQDYGTDLQKAELHRKVRAGRIRILFGSTELMGFGTNVQDLLIAEHHLDAPWRPRDVEQRDGRIERQGNRNDEIWIYRYVTEGSFDAYSWQTLETKAGFIAQVMEGRSDVRSIEDVTSQALSYAEIKAIASGNPLVIEKAGIDAEVAKLTQLKAAYLDSRRALQTRSRYRMDDLARFEDSAQKLSRDVRESERLGMTVDVGGVTMTPGEACGEAIMRRLALCRARLKSVAWGEQKPMVVAELGNFSLELVPVMGGVMNMLRCPSGACIESHMPYGKEVISDWLPTLPALLESARAASQRNAEKARADVASLERELSRTFEYEERLRAAVLRREEIDASLGLLQSDTASESLEEATAD